MNDSFTRRQFLISGALVTTGTTLLGLTGTVHGKNHSDKGIAGSTGALPPKPVTDTDYHFLSDTEAAFIDSAVARLIPADELGAGAKEAGCTLFIDRQLTGAYGRASHWYMQGPWPEGDAQQGPQSRQTPAQMYRAAIVAIDTDCQRRFLGKSFSQLTEADQNNMLTMLELGTVELPGVSAKDFFTLLLQNTIEGFFSDPLYGGNRDMVGWSLIGFPGARYDHRAMVAKHGERYQLPPLGILGRKAWN